MISSTQENIVNCFIETDEMVVFLQIFWQREVQCSFFNCQPCKPQYIQPSSRYSLNIIQNHLSNPLVTNWVCVVCVLISKNYIVLLTLMKKAYKTLKEKQKFLVWISIFLKKRKFIERRGMVIGWFESLLIIDCTWSMVWDW